MESLDDSVALDAHVVRVDLVAPEQPVETMGGESHAVVRCAPGRVVEPVEVRDALVACQVTVAAGLKQCVQVAQ